MSSDLISREGVLAILDGMATTAYRLSDNLNPDNQFTDTSQGTLYLLAYIATEIKELPKRGESE